MMDAEFRSVIRSIPDYPKPGIVFRDITTLLGHAASFRRAVDELVRPYRGVRIDRVAGIEARGFILGGAVARQLSTGFVPVRKKGKLPWQVLGEDYELEYGSDRVEIHTDAVKAGDHILVVDDLIATGGTCFAAIRLLERAGAKVIGCSFVIDLPDLGGADRLRALGKEVKTLVSFAGH
ncbi:MAG: adenine phosphoribosyltransferase [Rhizomicrobium sp.]